MGTAFLFPDKEQGMCSVSYTHLADDGNADVLDFGNDITAMLAKVKLLLYDDSPFL